MKIHLRLCAIVVMAVWSMVIPAVVAEPVVHRPFETSDSFKVQNEIDRLALEVFKSNGVTPARLCSDEVFVRRVYLDVTGTLPPAEAVRRFLKNPRGDKRITLIKTLMKRKEFADYGSLKWCDLLRVKAEFPINLWPNAVQAYHRWIHDAMMFDMPYDHFARELLTASGSNFRVPQVNFYRAIQGQDASTIARAVALTLMGTRLESWPAEQRTGFEAFFSQVAFKGTAEWKEEIVHLNPAFSESFEAVFPDGKKVRIEPGQDPRGVFADWLITADNPWFARNIVNRIWSWLLGRGIIHEPDDIRDDNPPVHPKILAYLEKELVDSDYDLKHIYQLILSSAVYQQSCVPDGDVKQAEILFACYPVRQLDAEVLIDALCYISGTRESYSSPIPEPFTFIPEEQRSIDLADGSITSQFLEMFGRPSRDTGLEAERSSSPSETQRRHLLNSTHIQNKIERSWRIKRLVRASKGKVPVMTEMIYINILSRFPTEAEVKAVQKYLKDAGVNKNQAANDLAWALINSKEFLYRH